MNTAITKNNWKLGFKLLGQLENYSKGFNVNISKVINTEKEIMLHVYCVKQLSNDE